LTLVAPAPGRFDEGLALLDGLGFNLCVLLSSDRLANEVPDFDFDRSRFRTVLLVGSAGGGLWASVASHALLDHEAPVDEHTRRSIDRFCSHSLGPAPGEAPVDYQLAWPNPQHREVPVMQLGACAGWHHPSPLGLGIHPTHGLWFAYRAVILLGPRWPERGIEFGESPCDSCLGKPCIAACPAAAVTAESGIDIDRCFGERLRPGAICGGLCLSRTACPVGGASRYPVPQVAHHHRFALLGWQQPLRER
jgi:hypothetical protein